MQGKQIYNPFRGSKTMKVLLILIDGMRPDALADIDMVQDLKQKSTYTMEGRTVFPSVTLPCHMSLFHSVDPSRHGVTTNVYTPQVRPVEGLCEVLLANKKTSAFFYNWEQLRDLTRPGTLSFSYYYRGGQDFETANNIVSCAAVDYFKENSADFTFLYLGYPDAAGHKYGWMSSEYHQSIKNSWENIAKVMDSLPEDYTVIITADHGGHERMHGTEVSEDMTIPIMIMGEGIAAGKVLQDANIKDIAPTVAKLLGVEPDEEWEGTSLL